MQAIEPENHDHQGQNMNDITNELPDDGAGASRRCGQDRLVLGTGRYRTTQRQLGLEGERPTILKSKDRVVNELVDASGAAGKTAWSLEQGQDGPPAASNAAPATPVAPTAFEPPGADPCPAPTIWRTCAEWSGLALAAWWRRHADRLQVHRAYRMPTANRTPHDGTRRCKPKSLILLVGRVGLEPTTKGL